MSKDERSDGVVGYTVARSDIAVYQPDEGTRLELRLQGETVWATEVRIGELFGVDRSVIYRHIRNIYRTGELEETATCAKVAQVQMEGRRTVTRQKPPKRRPIGFHVKYD